MTHTFWSQVRAKYPFQGLHLWYGAAGGVTIGLAKLAAGQTADLATTAGIASFVALSVGSWIGTELIRWNLQIIVRPILTMLTSVTEAGVIRSMVAQVPGREIGPPTVKQAWNRWLLAWGVVYLPALLLVLVPILLLWIFLDLGHGLFNLNFWRPMALGVVFLALGSLVVQQGILGRMRRTLNRLALPLSPTHESRPLSIRLPSGHRQEAQYWHWTLHTAFRRIRWITGVSISPTDL